MDQSQIIKEFHEGCATKAYEVFGAHFVVEDGEGVRFTVYAPHAKSIAVVGNFTNWMENPIQMERTKDAGIWSVFVKGVNEWDSYKYHIEDKDGNFIDKSDPYAFYSETRPETASKIYDLKNIKWSDKTWMNKRDKNFDKPLSIYEAYAGGWKHNGEYPYTYEMLKDNLLPYVKEHGFTAPFEEERLLPQ